MSDQPDTVIRCSSLSTYPECSRRSAAQMFRKEIVAAGFTLRELPHGAGAIVGTSVHKAAEVSLAEKAKSGTLPPVTLATDCAIDTLRDQAAEGVQYDGPRGATQSLSAAEHQVVSMARVYHSVIAPRVEPILIEERLEAEVAPGLVLSGRPDIVAREPGAIRDIKTSARAGQRSHAPQLGGYSLLVRSHAVVDVQSAAIDSILRVRPDKPQPSPLTQTVRLVEAETAAVNIIRHIAEDIGTFREGDDARRLLPGDPWSFLANPNSVLCGEKYCPAWGARGPHSFCHEWVEKGE